MQQTQTRRWRRARRFAFGAALFVLAMVLIVTFVPFGGVAGGGVGVDGGIQLQAAKLSSSNNTGMSASTSRTTHARLQAERVGVVNLSEHSLMRRVTAKVVKQLRDAPPLGVEEVVLLEGQTWALEGGRLADVLIVLDMPQHEESGMAMTGRKVKAKIIAEIGPQPWDSSYSYNDHLTPPTVRFHARLNLDHTSTTTGYESADARGSLAVGNIADELVKQLSKKLSELAAEEGVMPELPEVFYGARFEPSQELPLPDAPGLKRVYSGPRLMVHNETLWTMELGDREARAVLEPLLDELVAEGWQANVKLSEKDPLPYFRVSREGGADVVEAYAPRRSSTAGEERPERIVIVLQERFTREETAAAVQELFDAGGQLGVLAMFETHMDESQRAALAKRLMDEGTTDPQLLIMLAEHHDKQGNREAALATLDRAALLALDGDDGQRHRTSIEKAGRKVTGDEKWEPTPPDEAMLRSVGYELLPAGGELTKEVSLGEPANFYDTQGEELTRHSIVVTPSRIPEGLYTLEHRTGTLTRGGGITASTAHNPQRPWRDATGFSSDEGSWGVEAQEMGQEKFRITLKRRER